MNRFYVVIMILLVAIQVGAKPEFGLHFDDAGNIIQPDREFLWRGMDDEKDGFRDSAMKNFMYAAEFGNYHAMSLVGLYHMQDKDYVSALAWYRLIDLDKIPNQDFLGEIINNLESIMQPEELKQAEALHKELTETYGSYPALLRRTEWKNNLKFTGTNIKGYIPPFLRIQLNSGQQVTGANLRKQVDSFIFDYQFSVETGEVTLDEIELIEVDKNSEEPSEQ